MYERPRSFPQAAEEEAAGPGAGERASLVVPPWDEPHFAEAAAAQGVQQLAEAALLRGLWRGRA